MIVDIFPGIFNVRLAFGVVGGENIKLPAFNYFHSYLF